MVYYGQIDIKMKIQRVNVTKFRSIEQLSLEVQGFNIFVGQNNHGKTNLFEALNWFDKGKGNLDQICLGRKPENREFVEIQIEFSGLQDAIERMKHERNKQKLKNIFTSNQDEIKLRRSCSYESGKTRQMFNPNTSQWENPIGTDTAWNDLLPKLEYIDTGTHLEDIAKYTATSPMGTMLSDILETILEADSSYLQFKKEFVRLFGVDDSDPQKSEVRKMLDDLGLQVASYLKKTISR